MQFYVGKFYKTLFSQKLIRFCWMTGNVHIFADVRHCRL